MDRHHILLGEGNLIIDEWFDRCLERLRTKAIVIPPLDGVLRPNHRLEESPTVLTQVEQPDNAIGIDRELWFSSQNRLLKCNPAEGPSRPRLIQEFDAEITCMTSAPDGALAIGFENGRLFVGEVTPTDIHWSEKEETFSCLTALDFTPDHRLLVCQGSLDVMKPSEMTRDLMQLGRSGSVWLLDLVTRKRTLLADGLGYPYGVVSLPGSNEILVSECWQHRILKLSLRGDHGPEPILGDLPGYPARLARLTNEEWMLCLYAPRNRLVEFVLREPEFRQQMLETIAPEYWIAPALRSAQNFLGPLQQGGVKTMNIHKPWAPSLSYGLAIRLDSHHTPVDSYHSRANGDRHGITSGCQVQGQVLVTSKGGNCIVDLSVPNGKQP